MEAKRAGATVIHVDPRFTRTSAVADLHVPIRAGSDIAFLGALVNHVLSNDLDFREYVVAYTNAATIVDDGLPGHRGPRRACSPASTPRPATTTRRPGSTKDDGSGLGRPARPRQHGAVTACRATRAADRHRSRTRPRGRRATAPVARRSAGRASATRRSQHPHCVFQILKRHFARYTPEMVQEVCGISPGAVPPGRRRADQQQRARAHHRALLRRRLDPPQRRRADDPHGRDPADPARQHRPSRRRDHGAARARQHPGLDRHPDAVQHPAGLPADAARRASTTTSTPTSSPTRARPASGATCGPTP